MNYISLGCWQIPIEVHMDGFGDNCPAADYIHFLDWTSTEVQRRDFLTESGNFDKLKKMARGKITLHLEGHSVRAILYMVFRLSHAYPPQFAQVVDINVESGQCRILVANPLCEAGFVQYPTLIEESYSFPIVNRGLEFIPAISCFDNELCQVFLRHYDNACKGVYKWRGFVGGGIHGND